MVQLTLLQGDKTERSWLVRDFPFELGRSSSADLCVQANGVWDHHAMLDFRAGAGYFLSPCGQALVMINGHTAGDTRLRNGDLIELGSARVRFWLAAVTQYELRLREGLTWLAWGGLFALELGLINRFFG